MQPPYLLLDLYSETPNTNEMSGHIFANTYRVCLANTIVSILVHSESNLDKDWVQKIIGSPIVRCIPEMFFVLCCL